jgi:Sec-independent protein translocase protein TatA
VVLLLIITGVILIAFGLTKVCGSSKDDGEVVVLGYKEKVGEQQDEEQGTAKEHDESTEILTIKPRGSNKVAHIDDTKNEHKAAGVSAEQQSMTDFKQRLAKVAKLTPEAFFRVCDYGY